MICDGVARVSGMVLGGVGLVLCFAFLTLRFFVGFFSCIVMIVVPFVYGNFHLFSVVSSSCVGLMMCYFFLPA